MEWSEECVNLFLFFSDKYKMVKEFWVDEGEKGLDENKVMGTLRTEGTLILEPGQRPGS